MLKSIISAEKKNVFVEIKLIGFRINDELQFCQFYVFSILEIAFLDANFEIVNVVAIYIEMQSQRKRLFCLT